MHGGPGTADAAKAEGELCVHGKLRQDCDDAACAVVSPTLSEEDDSDDDNPDKELTAQACPTCRNSLLIPY